MKKLASRWIVALLVILCLAVIVNRVVAGTPVYVGKKVATAQRVSMDQIDHRLWDQLLHEYVDDQGRVAYGPWKSQGGHVRALDAYLAILSTADPNLPASQNAKLAFWINAYNAVTVRGILREYPTTSIRNHTAKVFGYNIWKDLQLFVGDQAYSLDAMEHQVLRKMGEPRIHFAIVCAAHSCPRLLNEAYTAERLDKQLTTNAEVFFANEENFRFDATEKRFAISSIIDWFAADFGADKAARLKTLSPWLPPSAQQAAAAGTGRISYLDYDWSLNQRLDKPQPANPGGLEQ